MMDDFWTTIFMVMIPMLADSWISVKLQSGHKSRHLDFIFDILIEFVKFVLFFYIYFTQQECVKRNLIKKWTLICSFLVIHFLK